MQKSRRDLDRGRLTTCLETCAGEVMGRPKGEIMIGTAEKARPRLEFLWVSLYSVLVLLFVLALAHA